jgi:hypothetical protein
MTLAGQRLGKHVPEVTMLTERHLELLGFRILSIVRILIITRKKKKERRKNKHLHLKARIFKLEQTSSAWQRLARARLPWNYTRFQHNAYLNNSSGTLEGGDFYLVLPKS